jgi:acyl-CoA reductase-like NAD-dependent aldehyde dehydrogenase
MKLRHKINFGWTPPDRPNVVWSERVEIEAAHHTERGERTYRQAQERVLRAQRAVFREERRQTAKKESKRLRRLRQILEDRREELARLDALLREAPAGSVHRGVRSYRGLPPNLGNPL